MEGAPGASLGGAQLRVWPRLSGVSSRWASAAPAPISRLTCGRPPTSISGACWPHSVSGAPPLGCPLLCQGCLPALRSHSAWSLGVGRLIHHPPASPHSEHSYAAWLGPYWLPEKAQPSLLSFRKQKRKVSTNLHPHP